MASDASYQTRSRAPSDGSQTQSQSLPPAVSGHTSSYRFITSTTQADSQESWRPEAERVPHAYLPPGSRGGRVRGGRVGRGRGKAGRGGGGGGGGGEEEGGGGGGGGANYNHYNAHRPDAQELDAPEWEKPDWTGSQISPNGYYHPVQP
ncbi:MAG: hypothetical protein FE78DRAFT_156335, partial [Acidomyces sp. 'richmondensis']